MGSVSFVNDVLKLYIHLAFSQKLTPNLFNSENFMIGQCCVEGGS